MAKGYWLVTGDGMVGAGMRGASNAAMPSVHALVSVQARLAGIAECVGCRWPGSMSRGRRALGCGDDDGFVGEMSTTSCESECWELGRG